MGGELGDAKKKIKRKLKRIIIAIKKIIGNIFAKTTLGKNKICC